MCVSVHVCECAWRVCEGREVLQVYNFGQDERNLPVGDNVLRHDQPARERELNKS